MQKRLSNFFEYKRCTSSLPILRRQRLKRKKIGYVHQPPVGPESPNWAEKTNDRTATKDKENVAQTRRFLHRTTSVDPDRKKPLWNLSFWNKDAQKTKYGAKYFRASEATEPFLQWENKVKLPPVQASLNYLTLVLFYKIKKNKLSPPYLQRLLPKACGISSHYHLRGQKFLTPTVRSSRALKAFLPRSIIVWNDLPPDIQALRTVKSCTCIIN